MDAKPLYVQLQERPYPLHQRLDKLSIGWLTDQAKPVAVGIKTLMPGYKPFPLETLYLDPAWFQIPADALGIHGIRHLMRVTLYSWILIQEQVLFDKLSYNKLHAFLQVALVHDIVRVDDNADLEHGYRSYEWIKQKLPYIPLFIADATRFHVEEELPNLDELSLELLKILKTADALDRFRLPKMKWWPDPSRMVLSVSPALLDFCKYVTIRTEQDTVDANSTDEVISKLKIWFSQKTLI
jgi:hypothetical protein